jgi:flagellar hook-length control protein FliK
MGVPQRVGSPEWADAVNERVFWMAQGGQQFARLQLNPPNLGPLEVRLNLSQDQASVSFIAGQAAVREALEAALPRLRDMFDQQSLLLVRAEVRDPGNGGGQQAGDFERGGGSGGGGSADTALPASQSAAAAVQVSDRLVDLFA